jgi:hypothetical protein
MKNSCNVMFALWVMGLAFGMSAPAYAATGPDAYYPVPSWNMTLPGETRFPVLPNMIDEAVLDQETGLVWQRSPSMETRTWSQAHMVCIRSPIGGRFGWRLPTVQELFSLVDHTASPFNGLPTLPPGHPFANVSPAVGYWTATTAPSDEPNAAEFANNAWSVAFYAPGSFGGVPKTAARLVWCVRGGQGVPSPNH